MSTNKIYIQLSNDIREALADNGLNVFDILQQNNIDAEVIYSTLPNDSNDTIRNKDIVPLILASGSLIVAISFAISNVLKAVYRKPYIIEYEELIELRDSKGNIMLDYANNPQFKRVKRFTLLEPRPENNFTGFNASQHDKDLILKFESYQNQIKTENVE